MNRDWTWISRDSMSRATLHCMPHARCPSKGQTVRFRCLGRAADRHVSRSSDAGGLQNEGDFMFAHFVRRDIGAVLRACSGRLSLAVRGPSFAIDLEGPACLCNEASVLSNCDVESTPGPRHPSFPPPMYKAFRIECMCSPHDWLLCADHCRRE